MRKLALTVFFVFQAYAYSLGQSEDYSPLKFNVGLRYQIGDSEYGPILGIGLYPYGSKFNYSFRTDVTFILGELQQSSTYGITSLSSFSFVDVGYFIAKNFKSSLGFGWAYGRTGDNVLFNVENGYAYGTLSLAYLYEWMSIEGRFDVPIMNDSQKVYLMKASMVSISIYANIPNRKSN